MQRSLVILIFIALLASTTCSKAPFQYIPSDRTRVRFEYRDFTVSYEYDSTGRLRRQSGRDGSYTIYTWCGDTVKEEVYTYDGSLKQYGFLYLNKQGLVSRFEYFSGDKKICSGKRYYDNKKHLVREIFSDIQETSYVWSGDVVTKKIQIERFGASSQTVSFAYTYLPEGMNTISSENKGQSFWGRESKRLPKTMVCMVNGITEYAGVYSYNFDEYRRVTSMRSPEGETTTYSYL